MLKHAVPFDMPHPMLPREGDFRICADVDAFKFLHREDAELRVLGVQTLKDTKNELGKHPFRGSVNPDRAPELYNDADIFTIPSLQGFWPDRKPSLWRNPY